MKEYKQSQYSDSLLTSVFSGSNKTLNKLERIYSLIESYAKEELKHFEPKTHMGRPGNNPEVLFKMLFIQHMQGLSDRVLVEDLLDRISFRRFVGIVDDTDIPDRSALINFRKEFLKKVLLKRCLTECLKSLKM